MKATLTNVGLGLLALASGLLLPANVAAQTYRYSGSYYAQGKVSLSIERAFGVHFVSNHYHRDDNGDEWSDSGANIGLGWQGSLSPFHVARLAIDGFLIDRLSLGAGVGFYTQTGDPNGNGFVFAPRMGYVIPISRAFSFWPRGGVSFFTANGNENLFALTGEAMFAASPSPDWSILFGATIDGAFVGKSPGPNRDHTQVAIGIPTVGIMGTF